MWDGCGPCSYCCTVINMEYDNAVCPVCNHRMSSHEAQSICSSYPGSLPLNVLSERECEGYVPSPIVEAMAKGSVPPLSEEEIRQQVSSKRSNVPYDFSLKDILGGIFSFFTKWKCPNCGCRSGNCKGSERISPTVQRVRTISYEGYPNVKQAVFNVWEVRSYYSCTSCGYDWYDDKTDECLA